MVRYIYIGWVLDNNVIFVVVFFDLVVFVLVLDV